MMNCVVLSILTSGAYRVMPLDDINRRFIVTSEQPLAIGQQVVVDVETRQAVAVE